MAKRQMGYHYKFYRLYYTVFAFVNLAAVLIPMLVISSPELFTPSKKTIIGGSVVAVAGLIIMGICIGKYFMQLSGLKGLIEGKTKNELMITGIHKFVRHPLYTGTFIFIWGLLIVFPYIHVLISASIITIYTLIGLRFEEQKLEKEFGDAYKIYKQRVPMLIPRMGLS